MRPYLDLQNALKKSSESTPYYSAVVVFDQSCERILLGKRREDDLYTSPAGGGKVGEHPKETAVRELFEEANILASADELQELPIGYARNDKPVHCYALILKSECDIGTQNDPDKEVYKWVWYDLDKALPELDENRTNTINNAKMWLRPHKLVRQGLARMAAERAAAGPIDAPLEKSKGEGSRGGKVVGHTKDGKPIYESQKRRIAGKLASDDQWKVLSSGHARDLSAHGDDSKQHSCAHCDKNIKKLVHMDHPEHGQVVVGEDCAEALATGDAQTRLKAHFDKKKEDAKSAKKKAKAEFAADLDDAYNRFYLGNNKAINQKVKEVISQANAHADGGTRMVGRIDDDMLNPKKIDAAIKQAMTKQMKGESPKSKFSHDVDLPDWMRAKDWGWTRHLPEVLDEMSAKLKKAFSDLQAALEKGRKPFPIGTRRNWDGQDYVKHADGWVAVGGKHHGKKMGKFKEDPTHKDFADEHGENEAEEKPPEESPKEEKPKAERYWDDAKQQWAWREAAAKEPEKAGKKFFTLIVEKDGRVGTASSSGHKTRELAEKRGARFKGPTIQKVIVVEAENQADAVKRVKESQANKEEPKVDFQAEADKKVNETVKKINENWGARRNSKGKLEIFHKDGRVIDLPKKGNFDDIPYLIEESDRQQGNEQMLADLLAKKKAKEEEKAAKKAAEEAAKRTPRENAEKATKDDQSEYVNARDSKFGNKGEDLKGSARHKAMLWKGLAEAEKDGTADKLVTRDKLLKAEPLDITVQRDTALSDMILHVAMQKFPAKPSHPYLKATQGLADDEVAVIRRAGRAYTPGMYERIKDKFIGGSADDEVTSITAGEVRREARKAYLETYRQVKEKFEGLAHTMPMDETDPKEIFTNIRNAVSEVVKARRQANPRDAGANLLAGYHNKTLSPYSRSSAAAIAAATQLARAAADADGNKFDNLYDVALQVAEGKSVSQITGNKKGGKRGFTAADAYLSDAMRKGPDTGLKDKAAQEKFLLEKSGIRGLQWGNSVTDDERKHHLEYVASSFKDLTEILGLPPEMGSFNGRLGLAIGARGKSRAMAHYEPGTNVINLTRKNGVGSLAHEWGHFFDKTLSDTHGLKGFLSDHWGSVEQSPVHAAMKDLVKSDEWGEFRDQVKEELRKGGYGLKADYWISTIEMFARAFEVHVDEKLRDAGRLNTYLAGSPKTGMWPTKELAAKLKPKFDKIFEAFKNSEHLKKAMEKLSPYADLRQALIKDI